MSIETGSVVRVIAGHDAESFCVVLSGEGKQLLLADGKRRPLEKPKRKNIRHIRKTRIRLDETCLETNRKLRRALGALRASEGGNALV